MRLESVQWWHSLADSSFVRYDFAGIESVTAPAGKPAVHQSNSSAAAVTLSRAGQEPLAVIVKSVNLDENLYRSPEHRERSAQSYRNEAHFYQEWAPRLQHHGLGLPHCLALHWVSDSWVIMVLGDLGTPSISPHPLPHLSQAPASSTDHGRSPHQRLALDVAEAEAALKWLARFHAASFKHGSKGETPPQRDTSASSEQQEQQQDLWETGGYWSLCKRASDVDKMASEWDQWLTNMGGSLPRDALTPDIRSLGTRLAAAAPPLDASLRAHAARHGSCLIHGDFKAANLFFHPAAALSAAPATHGHAHDSADAPMRSAPAASAAGGTARANDGAPSARAHAQESAGDSTGGVGAPGSDAAGVCGDTWAVSAIDFQWTGGGLGMQDVAYLLWASLDGSELLEHEAALLDVYCSEFAAACASLGSPPPPDRLVLIEQYEIAFLDYVRFLIGSMWGACTPATFEARRGDINQGMHKRDAAHQFAMVTRAAQLLGGRYSRVVPFDAAQTALWDSLPPALRIAAAGVHAAEQAGAVVRSYFGVTQEELDAKLKGVDDPQTAADLAAEAVLLSELQRPFPRMHVVGEEGVSPGALLPSLIGGAPCYAHVLTVLADALNRGAVPDAVERARDEDVTVWVDPLDGTRELLMDNCPAVTVLVGVAVSGVPVFGCIHQVFHDDAEVVEWGATTARDGVALEEPALEQRTHDADYTVSSHRRLSGRTWWGGPGLGVWRDREAFNPVCQRAEAKSTCVVATTRRAQEPSLLAAVERIQPDRTVREGGAGCKAVLILTGQTTHWVMTMPGTKRWDTCAPAALLAAAGGYLVDRQGNNYDYAHTNASYGNSTGVVAGGSLAGWERMSGPLGWSASPPAHTA